MEKKRLTYMTCTLVDYVPTFPVWPIYESANRRFMCRLPALVHLHQRIVASASRTHSADPAEVCGVQVVGGQNLIVDSIPEHHDGRYMYAKRRTRSSECLLLQSFAVRA